MDLWKFLAGVGLFLYGMNLLEQTLKKFAGRSFKLFLRQYSKNLLKAILGGTVITALVQSSSVVALLVLAFVENGIIPFRNGLGIILGSNVGTTLSNWVVATVGFTFSLELYAYPVLAVTAIAMFFLRRRKKLYHLIRIFFSISILFLGLGMMKDGASVVVEDIDFSFFNQFSTLVFVVLGFLITSLIQSSSATVAITLTALHLQVLTFPAATALVIGSELGTTMKLVLGGAMGSADKRRVAWGNFIFNIVTCLLAYAFMHPLIRLVTEVFAIKDALMALVAFQTTINIVSIVVFLPFIGLFSRWLASRFRGVENHAQSYSRHEWPMVPALATDTMTEEVTTLIRKTIDFNRALLDTAAPTPQEKLLDRFRKLAEHTGWSDLEYSKLKQTEGDILEYYTSLLEDDLDAPEYRTLQACTRAARHAIHSAKSMKDIAHNFKEIADSANDHVYHHFPVVQQAWHTFQDAYEKLLSDNQRDQLATSLHAILEEAYRLHDTETGVIMTQLREKKITELETSTLLNVSRELLSVKKALIRASAHIALLPEEADQFEFLP
jgi:phosphate:Na+ symporter